VRPGHRRAEAAVEEPEVQAADEPPVVPRERRVAGRQAGEYVEQGLVADAAAVSSPPRHGGSLPPAPRISMRCDDSFSETTQKSGL